MSEIVIVNSLHGQNPPGYEAVNVDVCVHVVIEPDGFADLVNSVSLNKFLHSSGSHLI